MRVVLLELVWTLIFLALTQRLKSSCSLTFCGKNEIFARLGLACLILKSNNLGWSSSVGRAAVL